jgi:two-component system, LytTR family, response regulator
MPNYSTKFKTLIIEDEENGQLVLKSLLNKYCAQIEVVAIAASVREAIPLIIHHEPDVIFLDIELPENNGFTLFEHFPANTFKTIFVTAYEEYALKALKLSAVDYLLKPIDPDELIEAVNKLHQKAPKDEKVNVLLHNINNNISKIALPTLEGLVFVDVNTIIRCEAQGNYTQFYFTNGNKLLISKTLAYFDELLNDFSFFRVNRNTLINMNFISKFQRGKKCFVYLEDNTEIVISDNKREEFMNIFIR